eukprot:CAMPEP_0174718316 /NCGR_PEP_ID=MMETSP1094-20130205/28574_1 /TAXON_ID=156173 /ORGANISM="Chrysochromulina brevifilum, Strain UTEX LB 985" /LENGTH=185 /DNA_ID=CAMNT_0015918387 /DNA_START=234 /DNA_END=787 /DNA_ORIENTATION=-
MPHEGFWNEPSSQFPYRVINQASRCQGPALILFLRDIPEGDWAEIPNGWLQENGLLWLRVAYSTLVPLLPGRVRRDVGVQRDLSRSKFSFAHCVHRDKPPAPPLLPRVRTQSDPAPQPVSRVGNILPPPDDIHELSPGAARKRPRLVAPDAAEMVASGSSRGGVVLQKGSAEGGKEGAEGEMEEG